MKKAFPYLISCILLVAINGYFFRSQLVGGKVTAPDEVNYMGASSEINQVRAETHTQSLWTNSMFSGMPTYQIDKLPLGWTPLELIRTGLGLFMDPMLSYFIAMSLVCFLCFLLMGVSPYVAALGAFAFTYTSGHLILVINGHYTKLDSLVYIPMILAGCQLLFNGKKLLGVLVFTTGLIFNLQANHVQMTYYIFLALAIFVIIEFIKSIQSKTVMKFLQVALFLGLGTIIAISANIAQLYTTRDYAEETIRGKRILSPSLDKVSGPSGLNWNFASEFSNGYLDLMSMIVPGFVGGSMREKTSIHSAIAEDFDKHNKKVSEPFLIPLYWGSLPSSSGPNYIGIISFILFCIGLVYMKGHLKYWALAAFLFLVSQSLGSHFFLNKFLFEYLPFYNKFRSPDSVLLVAATIVPWFGFYSLHQILQAKWKENEIKRLLKQSAIPVIIFIAMLMIIGSFVFDFTRADDKSFWPNVSALIDTRISHMIMDSLRSIALGLTLIVALYYTLKNQLNRKYFYAVLGVLLLIDLLPIARRCLPVQDYKKDQEIVESLSKSSGDLDILRDRDLHYRVMDKANNTFNDANTSLYHKSIGGYHPAKLRRYQDLIDGYLSLGLQGVINMLNAKYIITPGGKTILNSAAGGNAWFADTVWSANTPDEEFSTLKKINPARSAVVLNNEFPGYLEQSKFSPNGSITLIEYHPDQLIYNYNTTSPQLAVFSEIWYGPDKGWHAYIDHKEMPHIRVNYVLRALKIPAGAHTIEFKFYPDKVWTALRINRIILWAFFFCLLGGILYLIKDQFLKSNSQTKPIPVKK